MSRCDREGGVADNAAYRYIPFTENTPFRAADGRERRYVNAALRLSDCNEGMNAARTDSTADADNSPGARMNGRG